MARGPGTEPAVSTGAAGCLRSAGTFFYPLGSLEELLVRLTFLVLTLETLRSIMLVMLQTVESRLWIT